MNKNVQNQKNASRISKKNVSLQWFIFTSKTLWVERFSSKPFRCATSYDFLTPFIRKLHTFKVKRMPNLLYPKATFENTIASKEVIFWETAIFNS